MINPNYNYFEPINNKTIDNIAKGVPHPLQNRNIVTEVGDNHNLNPYNRENSELLKKKSIVLNLHQVMVYPQKLF